MRVPFPHIFTTSTHKIPDRLRPEPVRNFVYGGHEMMIQKGVLMIEMKKPTTDKKYPDKIFSDERIDPLLAQVQTKQPSLTKRGGQKSGVDLKSTVIVHRLARLFLMYRCILSSVMVPELTAK